MKWIDPLYLGEGVLKNKERILRGIREKRVQLDVYVLILPTEPDNQLEIVSSLTLRQSFYMEKQDLVIVGVAKGKEESDLLLLQLLQDSLKKTGSPRIRDYLQQLPVREDADA